MVHGHCKHTNHARQPIDSNFVHYMRLLFIKIIIFFVGII